MKVLKDLISTLLIRASYNSEALEKNCFPKNTVLVKKIIAYWNHRNLCSHDEDIEIYTHIHMALKSSKKIRLTPNLFTLIHVFSPFLFPKQIPLDNQLVP